MSTDEQRAAAFGEYLKALYEAGRALLNSYALDTSKPMPPLPDWDDLPVAGQMAFGIQMVDRTHELMQVVEHIGRVTAQRA